MAKEKDAYYFSHDSNAKNDEKILPLRADYGYEGYGLFWAIIESMRETKDYKLNYLSINVLSIALNFPPDKLKIFVDDCINKYSLFTLKGDKYYSNRLLRSMQKRMQLHSKMRANALQRWCNCNAIKERKGKESKVDNKDFELLWNLYDKKTNSKEKLLKKWSKINVGDKEKIMDHVPKYVQSTPDKKFRKNLQTYLNNESWNDEIIGLEKTVDEVPAGFISLGG